MRKMVKKAAKRKPARKKKAPTAADKKIKVLQAEIKKLKGWLGDIGKVVNKTKAKPVKKKKKAPAKKKVAKKK